MNREGGAQGSCHFGSKTAEHSVRRGQARSYVTRHGWANKHTESEFLGNSLKPSAASHNNASWCPDADGSLDHSPSGGGLDCKDLPSRRQFRGFLGGSPLVAFPPS